MALGTNPAPISDHYDRVYARYFEYRWKYSHIFFILGNSSELPPGEGRHGTLESISSQNLLECSGEFVFYMSVMSFGFLKTISRHEQ